MVAAKSKVRQKAVAAGFRSGLEQRVAEHLKSLGVPVVYEEHKLKYEVHETRTYTPDLLLPNGIFVEVKGRFTAADRKKHILVRKHNIFVDIRFVFADSSTKLRKGSKTSYADWCRQNSFVFADKTIPVEWLKEPPL